MEIEEAGKRERSARRGNRDHGIAEPIRAAYDDRAGSFMFVGPFFLRQRLAIQSQWSGRLRSTPREPVEPRAILRHIRLQIPVVRDFDRLADVQVILQNLSRMLNTGRTTAPSSWQGGRSRASSTLPAEEGNKGALRPAYWSMSIAHARVAPEALNDIPGDPLFLSISAPFQQRSLSISL
jgi:hypothetical protein